MFNILDIFFPRSNRDHTSISSYLSPQEIRSQQSKLKPLTKIQKKYLESIFISSRYDDNLIQDLMNRLKFEHETAIIEGFSDLIYQKIFEDADYFIPDPDVIVPIPADPKRLLDRGYSIPHKLSQSLCKKIGAEFSDILVKTKSTMPQTKLDRKLRIKNLKKVFNININSNLSQTEIVWLVDDICTTGTTITENAKLIKKLYPFVKIYGISVAGN